MLSVGRKHRYALVTMGRVARLRMGERGFEEVRR